MDASNSTRAGRYERQPEGYLAFNPAPLPPIPSLHFSIELQQALSRADRALGRLEGSIQILPQPDLFVSMFTRQEAVLSSRIEGNESSLVDVLAEEAKINRSHGKNDVYETIDYVAAMNYGIRQVEEASISTDLVKEIHGILLQNKRGSNLSPGEFRSSQVWIGPAGCRVFDAEFVPPPPTQVVHHMQSLDGFVESNIAFPLLVKVGLIHAQFETIHPFSDGNGRVGRLIIPLLLCKNSALAKPILYLSWYFNRYRQQYYEKLQSIRDRGAWEDWLVFFLHGVEETSIHAATTARRILSMRERDRQVINDKLGRAAANGHRLLDLLYEFPFTSVNEVRELTGTTFASANALVARMVEYDLLREYTGRYRNRRYLLHRYVGIFNDS